MSKHPQTGAEMRFIELRFLVPLVLLVSFIADVGLRFVPPRVLAFRAWEAATMFPAAGGPFTPDLVYHNDRAYGDLPNLGNLPSLRVYRAETFTTDAFGYRYTPSAENRPIKILVIGDSFAAGSGLSDSETLTAQLADMAQTGVYNCGQRMDWVAIENLIQRLNIKGGLVVWQTSERDTLDVPLDWVSFEVRLLRLLVHADSPSYQRLKVIAERAFLVRRQLTHFWESFSQYSPAKIVVTRFFKLAENNKWLPNTDARNVLVTRLKNGQEVGFLTTEVEKFGKVRPTNGEFFVQLQAFVRSTGNELLVLMVPDKYNVYYPLLEGSPLPPAEEDTTIGMLSRDLRKDGVPAVDLTPLFREQAAVALRNGHYIYMIDDTHWNAAGVRIAAKEILRFLPK